MYRSEVFENTWELTNFLNEKNITKDKIIQITHYRREFKYDRDTDIYTLFYMD